MILLSMQEEVQRVEECGCEIKGTKRARSRKVKYLGVWVDESLTWVDHVRGSSKKVFGRPHVEAVQKVFGRPGKAEKAKRYPACSPEEKYLQCTSVATSGLLLCTLARMRNPTSKKSGEDTKLCSEAYFSKPPRTPSEELKSDMNCIYVPIKKAGFVQVGTSAPVCAWACTCLPGRVL